MSDPGIVVTALAVRLPGAQTPEEFWEVLRNGVDRTAPVSARRRELADAPEWSDIIGEIDDIDQFDAEFFGIEAGEARFMDPQHRVTMEIAHQAIADAGLLEAGRRSSRRYSVHMAMTTNAYYPLVCRHVDRHGADGVHPRTVMNSMNSALAARISHHYDFTGPVLAVDTACSSFLTALSDAVTAIRNEDCDGAVVGGVNLLSSQYTNVFCNLGGITTGHDFTRVFDEEADGTLLGEGAVVCVLEREDVARAQNRKILARLRGLAINNDGVSLNIMAPNPRGQAAVIERCYADGIDHRQIGYIEAHGTGTRIGDPIELNALSKVYRPEDFGDQRVAIGSVKTNIGHLLSAAGGAGLAKLLLCLQHGMLVPSLHCETANPLLQLEDTPFEVSTETRAWPDRDGQPRMGAITSLGLGGTNVHAVLEQGPAERRDGTDPLGVLCLSAKSEAALTELVGELRNHLDSEHPDAYNLALTLNRYRPSEEWRAVLRPEALDGAIDVHRVARAPRRVLLKGFREDSPVAALIAEVAAVPVVASETAPGRNELQLVPEASLLDEGGIVITEEATRRDVVVALFLAGAPIAWNELYPDDRGTVLSLPVHPLNRQSHWLPK